MRLKKDMKIVLKYVLFRHHTSLWRTYTRRKYDKKRVGTTLEIKFVYSLAFKLGLQLVSSTILHIKVYGERHRKGFLSIIKCCKEQNIVTILVPFEMRPMRLIYDVLLQIP